MTPQEVSEYARQQWNAVSDRFFSDSECYRHIWAAQMELARKAKVIERSYSASTVIGQQQYSWPTNAIGIKRISYNGTKLTPITFREDDALTLSNSNTTSTGTPQYYGLWARTFYLRSVPDDVGTLTILSIDRPAEVSATSVLDVPEDFHLDLADYVLWRMALKDKNFSAAKEFQGLWMLKLMNAQKEWRMRKRDDSFTAVQDLETLPVTVLGAF